MRIVAKYSHLNGHEAILVHRPHIWTEIEACIAAVEAEVHRTKISKEERKKAHGPLYSPKALNAEFRRLLQERGWSEARTSYYVCRDSELTDAIIRLDAKEQKQAIEAKGLEAIDTYNQTDFVKDRVAVEFQFGKYSFVAHDLFVKHMAFFAAGTIDVGIEIVPMKSLERLMSSGVPYYERDLFNLLRQGRSTPAVPLVLVGIAP
jgi:hypothetical protein